MTHYARFASRSTSRRCDARLWLLYEAHSSQVRLTIFGITYLILHRFIQEKVRLKYFLDTSIAAYAQKERKGPRSSAWFYRSVKAVTSTPLHLCALNIFGMDLS